jgi:GH25 family lysozyme M1 (1,4-beta-N-acetylmuramidase)
VVLIRLSAAAVLAALLITAVLFLGRRGFLDRDSPFVLPGQPSVVLPGVDVSSHEPGISWSKAAGFGLRFVVARATEGDSRRDAAYDSIKREARAAGLAFTAFHFARPDRARGDAVREANLFHGVANIGPGYLAPVLDLEDSGGLGEARLQAWVTHWLEEVASSVGVKPMIYTNADFWRSHMGDTTMFAEAGYPLFVASWDALTPQVPADNWGGRGWTLWQTTKCGRVQGITGCIRTDVYNGADLGPLTIP